MKVPAVPQLFAAVSLTRKFVSLISEAVQVVWPVQKLVAVVVPKV